MTSDMRLSQMVIFAVVIVAVLVAAACVIPMFLNQSADRDLLQSGVAANARVLELSKTGVSRGPSTPLVRMKLEVQPPQGEGSPFQVELEIGVSVVDLPKLQPGSVVAVRYDPRDHARVLIVF